MFRTFLKWAGIALLIVAAIWITVIVWWQTTHRVISTSDAIVYLVLLPLLLLLGIGTFRFFKARARKKAAEAPAPGASSDGTGADTIDPQAAEKKLKLPIIAAWGITSLAGNAEEFVAALVEKGHRPQPDSQLLDVQGFPLPTGRVIDLEVEPVQEQLLHAISQKNMANVPGSEEWRDAFVRTLALLDQLIDQIRSDWPLQFETVDEAQASQALGTLRGAPQARTRAGKTLSLQIKLLITSDFKPYEKQLALAYLFEKISIFQIPKEHVHIEVIAANDDATALALLDKFNLQTHRNGAQEALLLIASDSTLCPTVAEDWQSTGRLFGRHCPSGLMMGEAAFGVLCVSSKALQSAMVEPHCHLSRVAMERRDISADKPGKPTYDCLTSTVTVALTSADISGEKIGTVACDADHRTNRTLECIGAMMSQTPQLDAIENRLAANEACGHIGAASVLGALVAGIIQSKNANHPILLFNVSHMADRAAAVLLPKGEMPQPT